MNPLNAYLAFEIMNDYGERADRYRLARLALGAREENSVARYDAVTIRRTTPGDRIALERLAELEGRAPPSGAALVAEVDEHILVARWIEAEVTLANPFQPTAELVSLLDARARHLGARPRLLTHPFRRAAAALRRGPVAHS